MRAHMNGAPDDHRVVVVKTDILRLFDVYRLCVVTLAAKYTCHVFRNPGRLPLRCPVPDQDLCHFAPPPFANSNVPPLMVPVQGQKSSDRRAETGQAEGPASL